MIELDKSFIEDRRRKEKEKLDRYHQESMKDYEDFYKRKDVSLI